MQTNSAIRSTLIQLIEAELEIDIEQLNLLDDDANLLEAPLFLDSVDLMQLSAACKKAFKLSDLGELSTVTLNTLTEQIITKLTQQKQASLLDTWTDQHSALGEQALLTLIQASKDTEISGTVRVIKDSAPCDIIKSVMILLAHNITPVLCATATTSQDAFSWKDLVISPQHEVVQPGSITQFLQQYSDKTIGFETSGSTGKPQIWQKSIASLHAEAVTFADTFGFGDADYFCACVDIRHMFGFIWAFMLPLQLGKPVCYELGSTPDLQPIKNKHIAVILTPTMFDFVADQISYQHHYLISSGAPFKGEKEQKLTQLTEQKALSIRAFEVLGSTETGGIGYRPLACNETLFTKFSVVDIYQNAEQKTMLRSPFLVVDCEAFELKDKLVFSNPQQFSHAGRADQIFKYAGKRFSLQSIEKVLTEHFAGLRHRVFFIEDSNNNKGGELVAFVEGLSHTPALQDIRSWFKDLPTPQVHFLAQFPENELGKITLSALQESVHE
ncbi:AMP-dependent synthetase [Pseudoalteromonas sp. J010]|uniref:AMP-binding protein n=1 Tax=Pseudoalteromonas sp. J010 TaxID=998465 RepID=UPI000F648664|nr:AMP-binding protein [Pseudoalteromonas sp. J010]RRS06779.1 AMP-dependent synthetase [Pseudoalteromonas sp. J010]